MEIVRDDHTFNAWLLSKHAWAEKTVGAVVLIVEVLNLIGHVFPGLSQPVLSQILNLVFLLFIFFYLRKEFRRKFSINVNDPEVARILRFAAPIGKTSAPNSPLEITKLVFNANTLISQLRNINYFVLFTGLLYGILLIQSVIFGPDHVNNSYSEVASSAKALHISIDILSYLGAFFLLRCFFVMYLPTVDDKGSDVLRDRTNKYILAGVFLLIFDVVITITALNNGIFIAEFICGVVNAVVFILLIARFENKILDIPPWILCLLYIYAVLQTCLPFVTENPLTAKVMSHDEELKKIVEEFRGIVLTLCLLGKVTLSAVILYALTSGRIFYYFITLRKIHNEEEDNWIAFNKLIIPFGLEPDHFSIIYDIGRAGIYTARIPYLFSEHLVGEGPSKIEAKVDLLRKLQDSRSQ